MKIPESIIREVVRWQQELNWPELVPAWAEIPAADGKTYWHRYQDLTVGLCEQATEFHVRKARQAIARFEENGSPRTARAAGRHILWARIFRCRFIGISGDGLPATEVEMPFAFMET